MEGRTDLRDAVGMRLLGTRVMPALVGRRGKYVVALFWLVVLATSFSLAGKLMGAEKNDSTAYLPGSAESTKVLNEEGAFLAPNTFSAIVVFQRLPALSVADRAAIAQDARAFARAEPLGGPVVGPSWSRDGQAAQVVVPLDLGPQRMGPCRRRRRQAQAHRRRLAGPDRGRDRAGGERR